MICVIRESTGDRIELPDPPLARGGEAAVYAVPCAKSGAVPLAAKIYHRPDAEKTRKLAVMIAEPPDPAPGSRIPVTWPMERLLAADGSGTCVGFLMPRVAGARTVFEYYNPSAREGHAPGYDYRHVLRLARILATVFRRVHAQGYVIGDVNERNILVTTSGRVVFVDCDSWQIRDGAAVLRCRVGRPEYTPPELQGVRYDGVVRLPEHDCFALAVLIWRLLMLGTHPFDACYDGDGDPPPVPKRIAAGCFPHGPQVSEAFRPPPAAPLFGSLPTGVRRLMLRCFVEGHADPRRRPSPSDWQAALEAAEQSLQRCHLNRRHFFAAGPAACPWCYHAALTGRDPFADPSAEAAETAGIRAHDDGGREALAVASDEPGPVARWSAWLWGSIKPVMPSKEEWLDFGKGLLVAFAYVLGACVLIFLGLLIGDPGVGGCSRGRRHRR